MEGLNGIEFGGLSKSNKFSDKDEILLGAEAAEIGIGSKKTEIPRIDLASLSMENNELTPPVVGSKSIENIGATKDFSSGSIDVASLRMDNDESNSYEGVDEKENGKEQLRGYNGKLEAGNTSAFYKKINNEILKFVSSIVNDFFDDMKNNVMSKEERWAKGMDILRQLTQEKKRLELFDDNRVDESLRKIEAGIEYIEKLIQR